MHLATNLIARSQTLPVKIDPDVALERQAIGTRLRIASARNRKRKLRASLELIRGKRSPLRRKIRSRGIDRIATGNLCLPKRLVALERPGLLSGPRIILRRRFECERAVVQNGLDRDHTRSRSSPFWTRS